MDPDSVAGVGRVPHGSSDDSGLLDFSANTNPRTPPGVRDVYEGALDDARTYPPEPPREFRVAAGGYLDCAPERVLPTPGGLAAIRLAIGTTVEPGDTALVPAPSFAEYAREVRLAGGEPVFVAHDRLLDADPGEHALAIVCNPNNPTGEAYPEGGLRSFARRCRERETTLLADEAFLDFTDRPSLAGLPSTIVARSLTKMFGVPGLRTGFAVAVGEEYGRLETARRAWNVGTPALAVGAHCLRREGFVAETRERVRGERARMGEGLSGPFDVHPSDAPFLLLDVGERDPERVVGVARERGVAIRDATSFRGLDSHVRVAVRLPAENDRLLEVLADA
jgi:histidinol-phosphate/aromatic aminotransferase/cobyric acid decarboxylase-like protein